MSTEYPDCPRLAVGGVVIHDGRVLLVCRGKPPAMGQWAIPGGSVELGETLAQAVEREIQEETGLKVRAGEICYQFESIQPDPEGRIRFHYVIIDFLAEYISGEVAPDTDASAAAWLKPEDLDSWPVSKTTLGLLKKLNFIPD